VIVALIGAAAAAAPASVDTLFEPFPTPPPATYPGLFDAAPAYHYRTKLPGPRLNSATHAEWSSPVIHGDRVYLGSAAGQAMYAMSRQDGRVVVTFPAATTVEAEATVTDEKVYFSDIGGNTYCYTLAGVQVWSHDGSAPVLAPPTLTPDGAKILVTNVDDLAVALDANTGELVWQYRSKRDLTREAELSLYDAPPAVVHDDEVLLGFSSGTLAAVDLETGEEQWKRSIGEGRYPDLVAAPVLDGSDAFASGYFQPLVALDLPSHNVRWRVDAGAAAAVTVLDLPSPDGTTTRQMVVHPGSDGKLRAVSALTGAALWTWDSGTTGALTQPLDTEAGLVVASSEGGVYLVDTLTGVERWRWHESFQLEGISTRPAVDGRQLLFVTNAGYLYSMLSP
jgi:outer membrane protein assembly factor BamB